MENHEKVLTAIDNVCRGLAMDELELAYRRMADWIRRAESVEGMTYRRGDRVWFFGRRRQPIHGTVEKVNRTTVSVKADNGMPWRVAPSLLNRVDKKRGV